MEIKKREKGKRKKGRRERDRERQRETARRVSDQMPSYKQRIREDKATRKEKVEERFFFNTSDLLTLTVPW
jgi:hypothetical protein